MRHLICLFACALALLATAPRAQEVDASLYDELVALTAGDMGEDAARLILRHGYAEHLGDVDTVAELAALPAAYAPSAGNRLTAAMLHYPMGRVIDILHEMGRGSDVVLAWHIEYRLRWRAGQEADAWADVQTILDSLAPAELGWDDPSLTSLLADAAVLAFRAGQIEAAEGYFARAKTCGEMPCAADVVQGWGQGYLDAEPREGLRPDPAVLLAAAEAHVPLIYADQNGMMAALRREHAFATGGGPALLSAALTRGGTPAELRQMAERLVSADQRARMAMTYYGVLNELRGRAERGAMMPVDEVVEDTIFDDTALRITNALETFPMLMPLLRGSDGPGHALVAGLMEARLRAGMGHTEDALAQVIGLIAAGRDAGHGDTTLAAFHADAWALARMLGRDALAQEAWARFAPCLDAPCPEDLVARVFEPPFDLPTPGPVGLPQDKAAAFQAPEIERIFPGDLLVLSELYRAGNSQDRPMDSARNALISINYALRAEGIAPATLRDRAAAAMDTLIYAGRYADAADVGDRTLDRLPEGSPVLADPDAAWFWRIRGRAAQRLGQPRAETYYARAIDLSVGESLLLDLMDTSYTDLLDRALDKAPSREMRARLRARQGRLEEAAELILAERRAREAGGTGSREVAAGRFTARAEVALQHGRLDDHVALLARAAAATEGAVPPDLGPVYARFWDMRGLAWQEAAYREAAGQPLAAARLRALGGPVDWMPATWAPLPARVGPEHDQGFADSSGGFSSNSSYDKIRHLIDFRDRGNYEAAAALMTGYRWVALGAEANGAYVDAQTLWQMAFTFARGGDTGVAFDLMNRAARIAATLSFEGAGGAGGGTLQLLERDRWRYLLFVDIAWARLSGQAPEEMLVVSRY
ncbi:hypothetical protein [Mesobacterium pallidum]|uniref:hypothetical protein n=1 Tax=Mesobacterium pallidum TaxID=2872037 RepID=UPI001EE298D7|nr:hypothetical protein [Mesobacterium pallidum]